MAMSIVLSGVVALTLTPVLCAMLLKPHTNLGSERGPIAWLVRSTNRAVNALGGRYAFLLRGLLAIALGCGSGIGCYFVLKNETVHHLLSENLLLTETRMIVISAVIAFLMILTFRSILSGGNASEEKKRGPLGILLHAFNTSVEGVTSFYAGILRGIVSFRLLTMLVIVAFSVGIYLVNNVIPSGFIPLEDQGIIYGIIQTPPGSTLEYTNAKSHELQAICKQLDEITSVSSLAGYEVLTEGRGSNAGTCIINLKPWAERNLSSKQIIQELEERGRDIANVKLEFFEPPAVPGFGAAGGFSVNLLDKTNTGDYAALGKVTDEFMDALSKRKELKDYLPSLRATIRNTRL